MKTTMEISDGILRQAKALARKEGVTLRALVEAGLRLLIQQRKAQQTFVLRDASFGGDGLQPEFRGQGWDEVRDAVYEGRGT